MKLFPQKQKYKYRIVQFMAPAMRTIVKN